MGAQKVVLAYSGGLDTSVILKWLIDEFGYEVICFAADVGQAEELDGLEEKAMKTGAKKIYIEDLREEFVRDYVFPAYRADVAYEGLYLLGTSLARPLIAKRMVEIARKEKAQAVAHGATGKGNDQVRFELGAWALYPGIKIIAPWKMDEWKLTSREKMIDYAKKHGIPVPVTKKKPYSMDRNLLHISFEGGILERPLERAGRGYVRALLLPGKGTEQTNGNRCVLYERRPGRHRRQEDEPCQTARQAQ